MLHLADRQAKRTLLFCLLLLAVTFVVYRGALQAQFLRYDDERYVTANSHVRAGLRWTTVEWAFTSLEQANWHPLTWLSHALDWQIFGPHPAGPHAINVLLHAVNAILIFLFLAWTTGYRARSLAVAALFALHPINVESVAWISERKTVLCMFFFLLCLMAYRSYAQKPGLIRYLPVIVMAAFALISKPMAVTLPFVLLLIDYWPLRRLGYTSGFASEAAANFVGQKRTLTWLIVEKVPFLALSALSALVTLKAQKAIGAVSIRYPFEARVENAIVSYALYLWKAVCPVHLAAVYPYPQHGWPGWAVGLSAVLLAAITTAVLRYRSHLYLVWGWFWFLGTMVPMVGLVQVGNQALADRYAYLPFVGMFVIIIWGVADLAARFSVPVLYPETAAAVVLIALSLITEGQTRFWHDDLTLWSHTLAVTSNDFVAEDNLGEALIRAGNYSAGIAHFRRAAQIEPGDPISQINLGIYAQQQGDLQQAAARYEYALQLTADPELRASAYANLGGVYFTQGDYQRARDSFESALNDKASFPFIFLDLGIIAQKSGNWSQAATYYAMYAAVKPNDVAFFLLGEALEHAGDAQRAHLAYKRSQDSSKDMAETRHKAAKLVSP
jgi:tetratricopeptide (TPR) repeat protein